MNAIPRMNDPLICRLLNVKIIGAGRLPREDLQTIDDAIEAVKASDLTEKSLSQEAWTWSKACENACMSDRAAREHLRLAIDHIAALNGALEDLASLGATVAICGTKYDDAAARECLLPNMAGARPGNGA